jgi:hypothetical protein
MIHPNSRKTYTEEKIKLGKRAKEIYEFLISCNSSEIFTDRQIMQALGYSEPNQVRPRITELIKMGKVFEVGACKCISTKKTVRLVSAFEGVRYVRYGV